MSKTKNILKNGKMIIFILAIVLALVAIHPSTQEGVAIRSVELNSSAANAGIESPKATLTPTSREVIEEINNNEIKNEEDYYNIISELKPNRTITIKTDQGTYRLISRPIIKTTILNETELVTIIEEVFDEELNQTINKTNTITRNKTTSEIIGTEELGLSVYDAPSSNIRKGLDLQGGRRVTLTPETKLNSDQMDLVLENLRFRLNVYGLSDISVRQELGLRGSQFIVVEIAGVQEKEAEDLVASQGKFEATIGNETVFSGGDDITYVCRSADCSGIDPFQGCNQIAQDNWACRFRFSISLSQEAAQRQADLTRNLQVLTDQGDSYLSESLQLYLDDALVDELNIGEDLRGRAVTDIQISGSGSGITEQLAIENALENMKQMQTVLVSGSLPVKLKIESSKPISPSFGKALLKNSLFVGLLSLLAVGAIVFIRYRKVSVALPIVITLVAEVGLILGLAALIGWNIDLAAIAGIIIAVGTGVDHLIIITDEVLKGEVESYNWKKKIKEAFSIILVSYLTTVIAMIFLWFVGAGLFKGFAITTILGLSIGVFIARPAYAAVIEILLKE